MIAALRLKRIDKLISLQVLGAIGVVWLVLVGLDAASHFARELGDLDGDYGVTQALAYILLTVPRRVYEFFGHAALIGGLLGLGALGASSELTAMRAAGISRARIMASALAVVAALAVGVVALGETAAPAGEQRAQTLKLSLRSSQLKLTTRSGLWLRDGDDIINAKAARAVSRTPPVRIELVDVRIFTLGADGALRHFTSAASAWSEAGRWELRGVRATAFGADGATTTEEPVRPWSSRLDPRLLELSVVNPDHMSLRDLKRNQRYFRASGQSARRYVNAWWAHIFQPLTVLLLVLATLPLAFGNLRSGGLGKRLFIGILLAIAWYFLQRAVVSLANVYGSPPWLSNLLPALVLAVLAVVHHRSQRT